MDFRIADTFTDSLGRLTGEEQKAVKNTAFDLQMNPSHPSLSFHKLDKAKDKNFWSVRVNMDIRLIVHKTAASFLLCYVDHHDKAYNWAERRKLETHPKTGAAQWVEIRERVEEIPVQIYVPDPTPIAEPKPAPKPLLFAGYTDDQLLEYGVPPEWLSDVRQATEDSLLILADHLPAEAAEALLELATGGKPQIAKPVEGGDPFAHPDAQRRFRIMSDKDALERALAFPWEKWTIFLHPAQQQWVVREYSGPARVSGSAGTGKTIVALHRAVQLARANKESRVLLATFSETLANALQTKLKRLISTEPRLAERIDVHSMNSIGERLYEKNVGKPNIISPKQLNFILTEVVNKARSANPQFKFSQSFIAGEWSELVDTWQLDSWESYRDVRRLGRKTRLSETQREALWKVFSEVKQRLDQEGFITHAGIFTQLASVLEKFKQPPFDFVVIDEAQDISVSQLKFLASISSTGGSIRPNSLFFAGDLGQRIFQQPFSWKSLGVDIRGRSRTLHINYRTSHQIRMQADKLLGEEVTDIDGNVEERKGTVSVFNGAPPQLQSYPDSDSETSGVAGWLKKLISDGIAPHEVGVFVRSDKELDRAKTAVKKADISFKVLDENVDTIHGQVSICTMHLAKGLEFRAVVVMACDDEIVPNQERIENITDESDLEEVYNTERHLLYVACTRARDFLLITSVDPPSEFLDDLVQE